MIMAPIDGRELAAAFRHKRKSPASCQMSQLLRLTAIMVLAGLFVWVTLAPSLARATERMVAAPGSLR